MREVLETKNKYVRNKENNGLLCDIHVHSTNEEMNQRQQICRSTDGFQNFMDVASKQQESSKENGNKKKTLRIRKKTAEIMRKWILY